MTDMESMPHKEPSPAAWKGGVFFLVLIAILAVLGFFVMQNRSVEGPLVVETEPLPLQVNVTTARLQDRFKIDEAFTGLASARRTSQLGFSSSGRIQTLTVDVGDAVRQGQRLGVLDTRGLRAQRDAAIASVNEAEASHKLALVTVKRQIALQEKGHVSEQQVDEASAQANTAMARIRAAEANVQALNVQIDLSAIDAPFSGTVTNRMADEGAIASPGQPVFELVESGALEARIGLTEPLAARLVEGETYRLLTSSGEVSAVLRAKTGVIDTGQRTVTTVFDIEDARSVAPGAVVRIALEQTLEERGLWLPVTALVEGERGLWSVYVVRRDGDHWITAPGTVEIVHSEGERVYVRGAVRDGDLVIRDGLQRVTPGQRVIPDLNNQTASARETG
ncbi:MAG: efflux RND transporter periplasmic adaptor subunit [Henriciella sp.]|nr:efflux RND transporter periplasmic adaptor subunit [Henriciella sp.]